MKFKILQQRSGKCRQVDLYRLFGSRDIETHNHSLLSDIGTPSGDGLWDGERRLGGGPFSDMKEEDIPAGGHFG